MSESAPPLQFESVDVVYGGAWRRDRVHALRSVSFSLGPGRVTGLVGANGAGKTTLLELAVGALRPTSGSVLWFGRDAWDLKTRHRIGFCADVPAIPGFLTVRESLGFFAGLGALDTDPRSRTVTRCLERLELGPLATRRVSALSRGNLVRLGIAQALLRDPEILVLDESLSPLDPEAQRSVRRLLEEEASRGAAILVSSHQLEQVERLADGIFMMSRGKISEQLEPGETPGSLEAALFEFTRREDPPDCAGGG